MDLLETLGLGGKVAEENVVYYALYPDNSCAGSSAAALPALLSRCTQLLQSSLKGYIWQRDVLQLVSSLDRLPPWLRTRKQGKGRKPVRTEAEETQTPACLWGAVRFGDNVDDEWFIVYLLLQLSNSIPEISIQVWDNDGDFLLIEAAYALPRWLKPEVSANRIWLRQGQLHIIPQPSAKHPTLPSFPSLAQALSIITSGTVETASTRVQAPINERLAEFPGKARSSMHRARVLLPASLARVLESEPQLVAAAVEAFSSRDAEGMKAASRMFHFPMSHDTAPVLVTFSRCLYAQLAQQRFSAPKGLSLPAMGHPLHKAGDLGLKVTAGFEILAHLGSKTSRPEFVDSTTPASSQEVLPSPPHKDDPAWLSFLTALTGLGYFQGNIPGSAAHRALTATAMADFTVANQSSVSNPEAHKSASPWERILSILAQPPQAEEETTGAAVAEDDDSWMETQGGSLDAEISRREEEVRQHASSSSRREGRKAQQPAGTASAASDCAHSGGGQDSGSSDSEGENADGAVQERVQEVDADALAPQLRGFVEYLKSGMDGAEAPHDKASRKDRNGSHKIHSTAHAQQAHSSGTSTQPTPESRTTTRAQNEMDVDLDPMSFFSELGRVLGMDLGASLELGFDGLEGLGSSWATAGKQDAAASRQTYQQPGQESNPNASNTRVLPTHAAVSNPQSEGQDSGDDESSSEGSSFFSSGGSEDGSSDDEDGEAGGAVGLHRGSKPLHGRQGSTKARRTSRRDVDTETDSDDDGQDDSDEDGSDDSDSGGEGTEGVDTFVDRTHSSKRAGHGSSGRTFARAYDAALASELVGTKMAETFERLAIPGAFSADALESQPTTSGGVESGGVSRKAGLQNELQPVDLDLNLVKNLIRSYTSQQGLSGPASNLAGLLGLELPRGDIVD